MIDFDVTFGFSASARNSFMPGPGIHFPFTAFTLP